MTLFYLIFCEANRRVARNVVLPQLVVYFSEGGTIHLELVYFLVFLVQIQHSLLKNISLASLWIPDVLLPDLSEFV